MKEEGGVKPKCGLSHNYEPEISMMMGLWVGVTQSGWSPAIWIPMKRGSEGGEAREGLKPSYIKPDEALIPRPTARKP